MDKTDANPADNWADRSSHRCETCMWFVAKKAPRDGAAGRVMHPGRCRRHAPTLGGWPVVFPSDHCGDHKLT